MHNIQQKRMYTFFHRYTDSDLIIGKIQKEGKQKTKFKNIKGTLQIQEEENYNDASKRYIKN